MAESRGRTMKTSISNTIDLIAIAKDTYKNKYKEHQKQYEERVKNIKENLKPNSKFYKEESEKAKKEFEVAIEKERTETKDFISGVVEQLRQDEYYNVRQIDSDIMTKLNSIADLPLSGEEISILRSRFAPKGEYWPTRILSVIAEKNGLSPSQFENSSSLRTRIDVLSQIERQADKLLKEYDGSFRHETEILLCDSVLRRAERVYCNGWANDSMEDEQVARRAFARLKDLSIIQQGIALQNIVNNTTQETKKAIFFEIANNGGVDESALRWAGCYDEFVSYKNGQHKDYTEARKGIDKTRCAENRFEVAKIADPLKDNVYYMDMLKKESESNLAVDAYLNKGTSIENYEEVQPVE